MEIDRRCNLVLTLDRKVGEEKDPETGRMRPVMKPYAHVHHTPIDEATYESHFWVLHKAVATMYTERMTPAIASRIGLLTLRRVAKEIGPVAQAEVEKGLLPEIWRRTNVLMAGERGYEMLPFEEAARTMDPDDAREVRNYITFFTAASWFHWRQEKTDAFFPAMIDSGAQIVSSDCTEYLASLQTSMPAAPSGATAPLSSIPH